MSALKSLFKANGVPALVRALPFDPRSFDYATRTGPAAGKPTQTRDTPTGTTVSPVYGVSVGRLVLNTGASNVQQILDTHIPYEGQDPTKIAWIENLLDGGALTDVLLEVPLKGEPANPATGTTMQRFKFDVSLEAQRSIADSPGVMGATGTFEYGRILSSVDGVQWGQAYAQPATHTLLRYCWISSRYNKPPYKGKTTAGVWMDQAAADSVQSYAPSMTVQVGDFVSAQPVGGPDHYAYEVVSAGTLEVTASNALAWPFAQASQVDHGGAAFASGSAQLVLIGPWAHSDGLQWGRGGHTHVYGCKVDAHSNSAFIIKSDNAPLDHDAPIQAVIIERCLLARSQYAGATGGYGYCTAGGNDATQTTLKRGGLTRSSGGVWSKSANAYQARPWGGQFLSNYYADDPSTGLPPASATTVCVTASTLGDHAVYVHDTDQWKAGVAAQFDLSASDPDLDAMLAGDFDWTTFMASATIDQTVLENRRNAGMNVGSCDARGWIVWNDNRAASTDALLHPTYWQGKAGFDADGYYTGT